MRVVIQRVGFASVQIEEKLHSRIGPGLLIFIGIETEDSMVDVVWLASKVAALRIFNDSEGKMNCSVNEIEGECMLISQFTLHAKTSKGNRPSFIQAAKPEVAIPLYKAFIDHLQLLCPKKVQTGVFAANMKIDLQNDGPVTILIDSKDKI